MSSALIKLSIRDVDHKPAAGARSAAFEMCLFVFRRLKNGGMVLTMVQAPRRRLEPKLQLVL